ncbi:GT2 family glycosyltransferase [Streptacidiphilus sp. MAP12-16]
MTGTDDLGDDPGSNRARVSARRLLPSMARRRGALVAALLGRVGNAASGGAGRRAPEPYRSPGRRSPGATLNGTHATVVERYRPVRVLDMELAEQRAPLQPTGAAAVPPYGPALVLVRLHGHPLGLVNVVAEDAEVLRREVLETAQRELAGAIDRHLTADREQALDGGPGHRCLAARAEVLRDATPISVVVGTHDRPMMLRDCLDSILRVEYPDFEVIVVDNAPHSEDSARMVRERYPGRVRYLREPIAGLSRARNRALAAAGGRIIAFADDDTLVDPAWLAATAETFAESAAIGCVTGLILAAELETAAQAALARHGDFGKGFAPKRWSLDDPPADPLFPFTAGRFGSGANMAVRTDLLRDLGGFDLATGPGTRARGGEDLLTFFRVLADGRTVAYAPDAVVWHRNRRTDDALATQAFGYGAGFGAYLAASVAREPQMVPALLRRLPRGVAFAADRARARPSLDADWSWRLSATELLGLLYGPVGYLRALRHVRRDEHTSLRPVRLTAWGAIGFGRPPPGTSACRVAGPGCRMSRQCCQTRTQSTFICAEFTEAGGWMGTPTARSNRISIGTFGIFDGSVTQYRATPSTSQVSESASQSSAKTWYPEGKSCGPKVPAWNWSLPLAPFQCTVIWTLCEVLRNSATSSSGGATREAGISQNAGNMPCCAGTWTPAAT